MNLCSTILPSVAIPCGNISGGVKSIEFIVIDDYLKSLPDNAGDRVTYYYRRGRKFFFKSDTNEIFIIEVSPFMKDALLPQLKRGQIFNLLAK